MEESRAKTISGGTTGKTPLSMPAREETLWVEKVKFPSVTKPLSAEEANLLLLQKVQHLMAEDSEAEAGRPGSPSLSRSQSLSNLPEFGSILWRNDKGHFSDGDEPGPWWTATAHKPKTHPIPRPPCLLRDAKSAPVRVPVKSGRRAPVQLRRSSRIPSATFGSKFRRLR